MLWLWLYVALQVTSGDPTMVTSAQHQITQDVAIAAEGLRLDRIERVEDAVFIAIVGVLIAQVWTHRRQTGALSELHHQVNSRMDELLTSARALSLAIGERQGRAQERAEQQADRTS